MFEELSSKKRKKVDLSKAPYAKKVLDRRPLAYWRLGEIDGVMAEDISGSGNGAGFRSGDTHTDQSRASASRSSGQLKKVKQEDIVFFANQLAVMVDTFRPLQIAEGALGIEDGDYWKSWIE